MCIKGAERQSHLCTPAHPLLQSFPPPCTRNEPDSDHFRHPAARGRSGLALAEVVAPGPSAGRPPYCPGLLPPVPAAHHLPPAERPALPCAVVHPEIGGQRNGGYYSHCTRWHELPQEPARRACLELMAKLEDQGRVDFDRASAPADPRFVTAPLFRPGCGKMLGVLLGRDGAGNTRQLRAFSGMLGGQWRVPGWAPLLCNTRYKSLHSLFSVSFHYKFLFRLDYIPFFQLQNPLSLH